MKIVEKIKTIINKNKITGNNHSFDIRKSLRLKLCLTMIIVVVVIIVLCWGINKLFLACFYENSKINAIEATLAISAGNPLKQLDVVR